MARGERGQSSWGALYQKMVLCCARKCPGNNFEENFPAANTSQVFANLGGIWTRIPGSNYLFAKLSHRTYSDPHSRVKIPSWFFQA